MKTLNELLSEYKTKLRNEQDSPNACPFCGSGDTVLTHKHSHGDPTSHFVRCMTCWAQGPHMLELSPDDDPKRDALRAWNAAPGYAE